MFVLRILFVVLCVVVRCGASGAEANGNSLRGCLECLSRIPVDSCESRKCLCNVPNPRSRDDNSRLQRRAQSLFPRVHCKTQTDIVITWNITNSQNNTYFFIDYINKNVSHSHYNRSNTTRCNFTVLENLEPGTTYEIFLKSITVLPDKNTTTVKSSAPLIVQTLKLHKKPDRVKSFYLHSLTLSKNAYDAVVRWEKGEDKACYYDIVSFEEDYNSNEIRDLLKNEELKISNLSFGKNYSLIIRALPDKDADENESEPTVLNFSVPTCHETFKLASKCVPDKPENLTAYDKLVDYNEKNNSSRHNIQLHWSKPTYPPNYYQIKLMFYNSSHHPIFLNVSGNSTNATIEDVIVSFKDFSVHYLVAITAHSSAGKSATAAIERSFNVSFIPVPEGSTWNDVEVIMIVVVPLIAVGLVVMLTANWYLAKKVAREKKLKYFKELNEKIPPNIITAIGGFSNNSVPDNWEINPNRLIIKSLIGEGAFGLVKKGYYLDSNDDKVEVAIKMMKDHPTMEELKQFYQEIDIMKSVPKHPHLVCLVACVTRGSPLIVVEYCSKGDLQSYLRKAWDKLMKLKNEESFVLSTNSQYVSNVLYDFTQIDMTDIPQPKDLLSFARQIVIGMEYLASLKLIHRDLAARNILLCENNTVKISDFGLSRDVYYDNVYRKLTGGKVPIRWMALECMTQQVYTTQSDVWAFGILLWEIVTMGSTPYPGIQTQELLPLLKSGFRMERPMNCSEELYAIMCKCWKASPLDRPTFSELRVTFDILLEKVSCYLNLNISDISMSQHNCYNNTFSERYVKQGKIVDV
nr:unnamed protein product [Callosobruchus chinensis]